jgi:hypothetical protein
MDDANKLIGEIQVTETSEILYYLDRYKGERYANVRKFSKSEKYTGPTKQGIKISYDILSEIILKKEKIISKLNNPDEEEILRINKSNGRDLVIRYVLYKGLYGFDIREMYKTKEGERFGNGIRIKLEHTFKALELMAEMLNRFNDDLSETQSIVKEPPLDKTDHYQKENNNGNVPKDIDKYF